MYEHSLKDREAWLDRPLWCAIFGLMLVSVAFIHSAKHLEEAALGESLLHQEAFRQSIWFGVGSVAVFLFCLIDYRSWTRFALLYYWLIIIMLILVLIPGIGSTQGWGAQRWINLRFFSLQPSEFAKVAFIFAQANFLSRPVEELREPGVFWKGIGLTLLPFLLIVKEPDLGSALVLLPVALVLMYVAGVPMTFLGRLVGGAALLVVLILVDVLFVPAGWHMIKLEDYQRRRILVYFGRDYSSANASHDAARLAHLKQKDDSYNVRQALISVGSGGSMGKGWKQSDQIRYGFLPRSVAHNDFIFSVIAEEKGFLGSVTVLGLYTVVLFAGLRTAGQARDRLGKLLAVGVVTLYFSHVFINIGMNIRIVPVTGIPLPLVSYGGSSVLCSLIAAGILQNVYLYRRKY